MTFDSNFSLTNNFIDLSKVVLSVGIDKLKPEKEMLEKGKLERNMSVTGIKVEIQEINGNALIGHYFSVRSWSVRSFSTVVKYSVLSMGGLPS